MCGTSYFLSSAVSIVNLYWLIVFEARGLLTFLSGSEICVFGLWVPPALVGATVVFLEPAVVSVAGTILAGGRAEENPAGWRLLAAGLETWAGPSDTDLDLTGAGFWVPCLCISAADLDLLLAIFPGLWFSIFSADGLGSIIPALAFQIDPIFDWTIFPLYIPRAFLDNDTAAGASFWASGTDLVSVCLALALRGWLFGRVCCFGPFFSWNGTTDVFSPFIINFLSCAGWAFSLFSCYKNNNNITSWYLLNSRWAFKKMSCYVSLLSYWCGSVLKLQLPLCSPSKLLKSVRNAGMWAKQGIHCVISY